MISGCRVGSGGAEESLLGDPDSFEDRGEIVGHQSVARALRKDGRADDEETPLAIPRRADQFIPPTAGRSRLLHTQRLVDLGKLPAGEGLGAAVAVVLEQEGEGLVISLLADQEPGGLGDKVEGEELEAGHGKLQDCWQAPLDVAGHVD